jgi:hypothetical protein
MYPRKPAPGLNGAKQAAMSRERADFHRRARISHSKVVTHPKSVVFPWKRQTSPWRGDQPRTPLTGCSAGLWPAAGARHSDAAFLGRACHRS